MSEEKQFPLQAPRRDSKVAPHPLRIPWSVAEKAYSVYAGRYGRSQSLERLAERGGFGGCEMDELYPEWRDEVSEIESLKAQLAAESKRADDLQGHYDRDTAKLQQEIQRLSAANSGVYWRWQGDGGDYLESLTCPILIDVGQLKAMFDKIGAAEARAKGKPANFKVMCIGDFTGEKIKFGNFKFASLTHAAVVSFPTMEDAQAFAQFVHVEGTALLAAGGEAKDASV